MQVNAAVMRTSSVSISWAGQPGRSSSHTVHCRCMPHHWWLNSKQRGASCAPLAQRQIFTPLRCGGRVVSPHSPPDSPAALYAGLGPPYRPRGPSPTVAPIRRRARLKLSSAQVCTGRGGGAASSASHSGPLPTADPTGLCDAATLSGPPRSPHSPRARSRCAGRYTAFPGSGAHLDLRT